MELLRLGTAVPSHFKILPVGALPGAPPHPSPTPFPCSLQKLRGTTSFKPLQEAGRKAGATAGFHTDATSWGSRGAL